jgi:hypothetical protein
MPAQSTALFEKHLPSQPLWVQRQRSEWCMLRHGRAGPHLSAFPPLQTPQSSSTALPPQIFAQSSSKPLWQTPARELRAASEEAWRVQPCPAAHPAAAVRHLCNICARARAPTPATPRCDTSRAAAAAADREELQKSTAAACAPSQPRSALAPPHTPHVSSSAGCTGCVTLALGENRAVQSANTHEPRSPPQMPAQSTVLRLPHTPSQPTMPLPMQGRRSSSPQSLSVRT